MARAAWLLPQELRKARERRGLSHAEVAGSLGVPIDLLQRWEEGEEAPSLDQASSLADLYHTSLQHFLEPTAEPPRHDLRAQRRMDLDEQEKAIKEAVSLFEHWCNTAAQIEEVAGRREVTLRRLDVSDPHRLATAIRQQYGLNGGPIRNIRRLLEWNMGALVFSLPLNGVSGMSWWHPRAGPAILVNRNDPSGRQNWTLAHELAHLLQSDVVVICDTLRVNYGEPRERFADTFAAEFLLPREDVVRYVQREGLQPLLASDETLNLVARRYHASREATARRLENLGLLPRGFTDAQLPRWIEEWRRREELRQRKGYGRRVARRKQRVRELGEPFVERAIRAYRESKITLSKLAEELGLGIVETEDLVAEWPAKGRTR
jgi:Zn-dependent peptidase ImmA (M78 family)/DNA-binding XRE family transcriptional regulator